MVSKRGRGNDSVPDLKAALAAIQAHIQADKPKPPEGYYSAEEFAAQAGVSVLGVSRQLRHAFRIGLVDRVQVGKTHFYKPK